MPRLTGPSSLTSSTAQRCERNSNQRHGDKSHAAPDNGGPSLAAQAAPAAVQACQRPDLPKASTFVIPTSFSSEAVWRQSIWVLLANGSAAQFDNEVLKKACELATIEDLLELPATFCQGISDRDDDLLNAFLTAIQRCDSCLDEACATRIEAIKWAQQEGATGLYASFLKIMREKLWRIAGVNEATLRALALAGRVAALERLEAAAPEVFFAPFSEGMPTSLAIARSAAPERLFLGNIGGPEELEAFSLTPLWLAATSGDVETCKKSLPTEFDDDTLVAEWIELEKRGAGPIALHHFAVVAWLIEELPMAAQVRVWESEFERFATEEQPFLHALARGNILPCELLLHVADRIAPNACAELRSTIKEKSCDLNDYSEAFVTSLEQADAPLSAPLSSALQAIYRRSQPLTDKEVCRLQKCFHDRLVTRQYQHALNIWTHLDFPVRRRLLPLTETAWRDVTAFSVITKDLGHDPAALRALSTLVKNMVNPAQLDAWEKAAPSHFLLRAVADNDVSAIQRIIKTSKVHGDICWEPWCTDALLAKDPEGRGLHHLVSTPEECVIDPSQRRSLIPKIVVAIYKRICGDLLDLTPRRANHRFENLSHRKLEGLLAAAPLLEAH